MDLRLMNGNPKVTVIQRFNHSIILIGPGTKKEEFPTIEAMKLFVERNDYEINIAHIHPGQVEKD